MYEESGYVIAQRYSSWQKKKVRTIVVNAHAKGPSQKSIASAIAIAKPYDRVELTGGEYNESIIIQMPLELVAAEGEDPHILSRSSTITLTAIGVDVYMERLLISSRSTSKLDAAVVAINGNPILYRCQCTSIFIGGNAMAHIDECTIQDSGAGVGITVQDSGGGLIKSTYVRAHRNTCVEIDTRGELAVTDCTIGNSGSGNAMVISGAISSLGRDGSAPYTACSHVEVVHCHLSVLSTTSNAANAGDAGGSSLNSTGDACCIVLTQGAAPTIASNELAEGEVGILIEGPGTAQLRGNVVRCQRRCGILALVDEGFGYAQEHQTLRITGDNILDRCRIGIDVQCVANRVSYAQQSAPVGSSGNLNSDNGLLHGANSLSTAADRVLSDELPNPKRVFSWMPSMQGGAASFCTIGAAGLLSSSTPGPNSYTNPTDNALICVEGEWCPLDSFKSDLQHLVRLTLQTYPTCLQPSFGIAAGTTLAISENGATTSANPFADVLNEMLGMQLSSRREVPPSPREMLQLRGNKGIDIINTKFSNCDVCAIRFGRQGYGLVEECVFEDCGTYAIVVDCAAHPLITGCRFLRSRGASILVSNFANPLIIGNEMANGKRDGIHLSNMSRGLIVGNIIATHVGVGIQVGEHSQPVICANAISQNRKGGVAVVDSSRPTILLNTLAANLTAQIYCTLKSDAFICRNRITASADVGLHIDACSRCTVVSNTIRANGTGMLVELDADPYVQGNDVMGNIYVGIKTSNNALGSFVGNFVVENQGPNVLVEEGAAPVFRGNRIEGSPQGGAVVLNEGQGFFECNTLAANGVANVVVVGSYSEPRFTRNAMYGSLSGCGIVCARNAGGDFTHNRVYENAQCGVYVCDAADPTFTENNISREAVGVLMSDSGKGTFTTNVIADCYGCGVMSQHHANPTFSHNTVTRCQLSGLQVVPDSLGVFTANELTKNDIGVHIGSSLESAVIELSSPFLSPSKDDRRASTDENSSRTSHDFSKTTSRRSSVFCTQNDKSGVLQTIATNAKQRRASAARAALSLVADNVITNNVNGGVLLDAFANAKVENNDIFENNAYGVRGDCTYTAARAQAILQQKLDGVAVPVVRPKQQNSLFRQLQTKTVLRANKIHGHGAANILLDHFDGEENETSLTQNAIYDAPYGMCVVNNSTIHEVRENDIYDCVDGICCSSRGRGQFVANHIHNCTYSGVCIADMADPEFREKNQIEQCGFAGVLVDVGGHGTFSKSGIRHCNIGVVIFCGPATPFQMPYDEVVKARLVDASPTFTDNTIEENELHGVLLLSVISGCPLRTLLVLPKSDRSPRTSLVSSKAAVDSAEAAAHDTPFPYVNVESVKVGAQGRRMRAFFEKNVIRRNRVMGVYHDLFEHWDMVALDNAHAERKLPSTGNIKNAYGGYEILLGTSQVLDNTDHQRQRQLKQVSFVDNTITECSIGFGAGYGCHPYLERNKIHHNTFFGLLLRFGSAISATGNDICENGLAGVYAASGAKGYIANGAIEANNGWCRPEATPHESRNFNECIFHSSFFSPESVQSVEEKLLATEAAALSVKAAQRAYEQMTKLAVVHTFTMTDALRYLADLVAASSVGLTLATGCVPASLEFSASASPGTDNGATSRRLGGVKLPDYTEICTADGGIGAWVQNGSRVSFCANRIANHTNAGVLVSRGVLQHHRTLHKAFHVEPQKKGVNSKQEMLADLPGATKVVLRTEMGPTTADIFAVEQTAPPLATTEPGAVFTPQMLCVKGILAAVQLAASYTLGSMDTSFASFPTNCLSLTPSFTLKEAGETEQRLHSIHYAFIAGNVITGNRDGILLELFHTLQASASIAAAAAASASASTVTADSNPSFSPKMLSYPRRPSGFRRSSIVVGSPLSVTAAGSSTTNSIANSSTADSAADAAYGCFSATDEDISVMDSNYGGLDFSIIVEGNRISQNRRYGVYARHVSTINCGSWLTNRGVLKDAVDMQYEDVRSQLALGKQSVRIEVRMPFEVHAVKQKIGHALLRKNDISGNEQAQAYVTSRHVAITQDGDRTLLQMDTTTGPSASFFASQVLVGVPLYSALLQRPPPGVLLWEENRFHDGRRGVQLCGYLGSHSVRFQCNAFLNFTDDAFLVEGHLACATIGKGNIFDRNGVSLRVLQQQQIRLVTSPTRTPTCRTRVFQNTFKGSKDSSILLECVGVEAPLLYRNEFKEQPEGSAALFLHSGNAAEAAVVQGNVFADSYVPVFIVGRSDSGVESALSTSRILLVENCFMNNYIGALVCNGAYPVMERNLFSSNMRAGLEIVGNSTRPQVRKCLFHQHKRAEDDSAAASTSLSMTMTAMLKDAPHYPDQGTLMLQSRNFSVTLLPENARVLGPTSPVRLPAGLLVGPFAEPHIENCGFVNNDVGVDAVRNVSLWSLAVSGFNATFKGCGFTNNSVCGVLVRGLPDATEPKVGVRSGSSGAARTSVDSRPPNTTGQKPTDGIARAGVVTAEAIVFEQCVFSNNATTEGFGDVVAMDNGYAVFRNNIFHGTVVGQSGAVALFTQNRFWGPQLKHNEEENGVLIDAKDTSAPAVVVLEGGRIVADRNTIVRRLMGAKCMPGAEGVVRNNRIVQCVVGLMMAPFNRTEVNNNRVLACGECGVVAYGGRIADNEIVQCPSGIVVQHSSSYKGINAIPVHKRDTLEFLCSRNNIIGCTGNGLLISTAGVFDSNNIAHCKTGVSIVSPLGGGAAGAPPTLKNSNVYDNVAGIYMENDSESAVKDNDVFDNEIVGVVVMPNAAGVLQGNRISSALDQGAVEIPTEARIKSSGNVIRNQFSPAFQRGSRGGRAKEYQAALTSLKKEFDELEAVAEEAQHEAENTMKNVQILQRDLIELHSRLITDSAATLAGSAGHALRNAATSSAAATANHFKSPASSTVDEGLLPFIRGAHADASNKSAGNVADKGSNDQMTSSPSLEAKKRPPLPPVGRVANSGSRHTPIASTAAVRKSTTSKPSSTASTFYKNMVPPRDTISASSKLTPSVPTAPPKQVLIHVFAKAEARTNAGAVGQVIISVLAKPPLTAYNFSTTITTSTSQLLHTLASSATQPYLCVVVLDTHLDGLSPSDCHALQQLHDCATARAVAGYRGFTISQETENANHSNPLSSAASSLFYTLVPRRFPLAANKKAVADAGEGMSVEAYAAAHHPFTYKSSVEEVLTDLHAQISDDLKRAAAGPRARRRGSVAVLADSYEKTGASQTAANDEDELLNSISRRTSNDATHSNNDGPSSGKPPTKLTAEYVGALLSQLTPEALGFVSPNQGKQRKRRKSSVAASGQLNDGGEKNGNDKESRRNSVHPRRSSVASKSGAANPAGAPAALRKSSLAPNRSNRRASVASKKQ